MNKIRTFRSRKFGLTPILYDDEITYVSLQSFCRALKIAASDLLLKDEDIKSISRGRQFLSERAITEELFKLSIPDNFIDYHSWLNEEVFMANKTFGEYSIADLKDARIALDVLNELQDLKLKISILQSDLEIANKKISFIDKFAGNQTCDFEAVPRLLKTKNISLTELLKILRASSVFNEQNEPLQQYIDLKYFKLIEAITYEKSAKVVTRRTYVYQRGISFIEQILKKYAGAKNG